MHRHRLLIRIVLFLLVIGAAGCAGLPVTGSLPGNVTIAEVSSVDEDSPFAFAAGGGTVAFANGGLRIRDLASGRELPVSADAPTALSWSPDGAKLAAAFSAGGGSVLRLFDREGAVQAETRVPGRVNALAWGAPPEVMAFVVTRQVYRFGTNLAEVLHRWDGKGKPTSTPLSETTLMPASLPMQEQIIRNNLTFAVSPLHDEILYTRLYAPPAFTPYLKLILRNLENGREREVGTASPFSAGGLFSGSGDWIVYGEGESESRQIDPWRDKNLLTFSSPGRTLALSPSGHYLLLDGHLYRDGQQIATFPSECNGAFAPQGGRLAIRYGKRLYLVDLPADGPVPPLDPAGAERLRQLRKWLSEGLITVQEYRTTVERKSP
jgi:hypothetical protein